MARKTPLSDQAVGFMLEVKADTALKDLKEAESRYRSLEKTVKEVADSIAGNTAKVVSSMNNLSGSSVGVETGMGSSRATAQQPTSKLKKELDRTLRVAATTAAFKDMTRADVGSPATVNATQAKDATDEIKSPLSGLTADNISPDDIKNLVGEMSMLRVAMDETGNDYGVDKTALRDSIEKLVTLWQKTTGEDWAGGFNLDDVRPPSQDTADQLHKTLESVLGKGIRAGAAGGGGGDNPPPPQAPAAGGMPPDDPNGRKFNSTPVRTAKDVGGIIDNVIPQDLKNEVKLFTNTMKAAFGKVDDSSKNFWEEYEGRALTKLGVVSAAIMAAIAVYDDFSETLNVVRKQAKASEAEMSKLGDTIINTSKNTGQDFEDVAKAVIALRQKGITKLDGDFNDLVDTSVKLAEIFGVNQAEMGEFIADVSKGMKLGSKTTKEFGKSLIEIAKQGGVSFDQLKDSVSGMRDIMRRMNFKSEKDRIGVLKSVAAATAAVTKNMGNANTVQEMMNDAQAIFTDRQTNLMRLMQRGGFDGSLMDLKNLTKSEEGVKKIVTSAKLGADSLAEMYGGIENIPESIAQSWGGMAVLEDLINTPLEDINKNFALMNKITGQNNINDDFKAVTSTLSEIKDKFVMVMKTFMAYVGKPILEPLLYGLRGIVAILQAIPAPIYKVGGALTAVMLVWKAFGWAKDLKVISAGWGMVSKKIFASKVATEVTGEVAETLTENLNGAATKGKGLVKTIAGMAATNPYLAAAGIAVAVIAAEAIAATVAIKAMSKAGYKGAQELQAQFGILGESMTGFKDGLKGLFSGDGDAALKGFGVYADKIGEFWKDLPDKILAFVDEIPDAINDIFNKITFEGVDGSSLADKFLLALPRVAKGLLKILFDPSFKLRIAKALMTALMVGVWRVGEIMLKSLKNSFVKAVGFLGDMLKTAGKWWYDATVGSMIKAFREAVDWAKSAFSSAFNFVGNLASKILTDAIDRIPFLGKIMKFIDKDEKKNGVVQDAEGKPSFGGAGASAVVPVPTAVPKPATSSSLTQVGASATPPSDPNTAAMAEMLHKLVEINMRWFLDDKEGKKPNNTVNVYNANPQPRARRVTDQEHDALNGR